MMKGSGMREQSHWRERRVWAFVSYGLGLAMLSGFLLTPMYQMQLILEGGTDERWFVTGWMFMKECWAILRGTIGGAIPLTPSAPWWLVNAPILLLMMVVAMPCLPLLWFSTRSTAAMWLGRIWWAAMFLTGPGWYLFESGPDALAPVIYEGLVGGNLLVLGALLITGSFWVVRVRRPDPFSPGPATVH